MSAAPASRDAAAGFRFGVLLSRTGVTAATELAMLRAVTLAVEQVNAAGGIDGRELSFLHFDPGSDPVYYNFLAEKLIVEHGVRVMLGGYRSSARKAVIPVVERLGGLLLYPSQYEGFEYSPNVIYGGAVANQNTAPLAEHLLRHVGDRVFMIGSNYVWPREASRALREMLERRGGAAAGEAYFRLDEPRESFDAAMIRIRDAAPDAIFCNLVGPTIGAFHRAYADAGMDPARTPIASLTTSEVDVHAMGAALAAGHLTSAPYFRSVATDGNRAFVAAMAARFGPEAPVNLCAEAAYSQVRLLAGALGRVGADDAAPLRRALLGARLDAPQGEIAVCPDTAHTHLWPRIGRVGASGCFEIVSEVARAVAPDPWLTRQEPTAQRLRRPRGGEG